MRLYLLSNIDTKPKDFVNVKDKCTTIPGISAKPFDGWIPLERLFRGGYSRFRIVDICRMNNSSKQVPRRVYDDMPFSA